MRNAMGVMNEIQRLRRENVDLKNAAVSALGYLHSLSPGYLPGVTVEKAISALETAISTAKPLREKDRKNG